MLTRTAMTEILVPSILAAQSAEPANTPQRLALALQEMLDSVTPLPDNVHLLQHVELAQIAKQDNLAVLPEVASTLRTKP